MKKLLLVLTAVLSVLFAQTSSALISGSSHDFSGAGWNSGGEICEPCHTPHNGDMAVIELWNHENAVATTFTEYSGLGNLNAVVGDPAGVSLACLSCHDGVTGMDAFGGSAGVPTLMAGAAALGQDLSNDHPVSFTYNTALSGADGELYDPSSTLSGLGGDIDEDILFGAGNDQMECASCHDVHNTAAVGKMLVKDNAGSALCLTCHNK